MSARTIGWTIVVLLVLVSGALFSGVLGSVLMVEGVFGIVAMLVLLFIGTQAVLFRMLGLRSRADQPPSDDDGDDPADEDDERDWRAWRG